MRRPKGFSDAEMPAIVRLLGGLYIASKLFEEHFSKTLTTKGFKRLISDPQVFRLDKDGDFCLLSTFVDDALAAASPGSPLLDFVEKELELTYKITIQKDPHTSNDAQKKEIRQSGHKLKTIHLNCGHKGIAQSYYVNSMELRNYLSKAQPDIVLLQEIWLHKKSTVSFPGYEVLRKDRPADYGAEVATVILKDAGIKYDKIDEDIASNNRCSDVLVVKIVWYGHTFIPSNIYSPLLSTCPTGRPAFSADHTLTACLHRGPNQIKAGDFNAHSSIWDAREDILPNQDGEDIEEWITSNEVQFANNGEPTYTCKITRKKFAIDLEFHAGKIKVSDWRPVPEPSFSDHASVSFDIHWNDLDRFPGETPRKRTAATITKFCYDKADWSKFNKVFQDAYINYKDPPRMHDRKKRIERPRTNVVEIESRNIANAFQRAMKTLPQGCRRDSVPWWDDELDEAIIERIRLKKIRDLPASDEIHEMRQLQYREQAEIVQKLILSKRKATWLRFATDHLRYSAGPKRTAAMIKLLAREPRYCPDQILRDKTGRTYVDDKGKAAAYLRLFSQVSKRELKPMARRQNVVRPHRYRSARQAQTATVHHLRQKEAVRASLRVTGTPLVSMFELRTALAMIHTGRATGIDRVSNEIIKNLNRINLGRIHKLINLSITLGRVPTA